jgi:hypothetical protein
MFIDKTAVPPVKVGVIVAYCGVDCLQELRNRFSIEAGKLGGGSTQFPVTARLAVGAAGTADSSPDSSASPELSLGIGGSSSSVSSESPLKKIKYAPAISAIAIIIQIII